LADFVRARIYSHARDHNSYARDYTSLCFAVKIVMSSAQYVHEQAHGSCCLPESIEGNVFKACHWNKAGFACKGSDDGQSVIASFALFL